MGCCGLRTLFMVAMVTVLVAYLANPGFPDTASNRALKSLVVNYLRLATIVSKVGGFLGIDSPVNISRHFYSFSQTVLDRGSDTVEVSKTTMDGVEVLIFRPSNPARGLLPGIVHYHGGGWIVMSPETYSPVCQDIVDKTQSVVVSVNYRLAPEHVFPAAIDDCLKATRHFLQNAEHYGVDSDRIGVKGDSAGGNLAMCVALQLAKEYDGSLPKLRFQSLDYPALQAVDFNLPSHIKHGHGPGMLRKANMLVYCLLYAVGNASLTEQLAVNNHTSASFKSSQLAEFVNRNLLPEEFIEETKNAREYTGGNDELFNKLKHIFLNPLFMPLMATDEELKHLPPTYIMSVEFDVLRDDAFLAAARLRAVGVRVSHNYIHTEQHGFLSLVGLDQNAKDEFTNFAKFFSDVMQS